MQSPPEPESQAQVRAQSQAHHGAGFMAWHYTTARAFLRIVKAHALSPGGGQDGSKAVVWFSVNDDMEPSAFRHAIEEGEMEGDAGLSMRSTKESAHGSGDDVSTEAASTGHGVGMVRLGVPVRTLLTCAEVRRRAAIGESQWQDMCEQARESGGDPDQWFGSLRAVPLRECLVEVRTEDGQWRRMQGGSPATLPSSRGVAAVPHHLVGR